MKEYIIHPNINKGLKKYVERMDLIEFHRINFCNYNNKAL